ncbi:PAS domain-containing protein [Actinotalea sp. Marseille-Q4924]|uniref:PAS domain-containing protein n=1 Tax=Actinotalea sp. Marseille-Q4924 TaxID=2866571 RepID=UPI001CE3F11D|nr:PAS domain-containing protein [Actinotalea sp. Marseille-Q4924]
MSGSASRTRPTVLLEDVHGTWTAVAVDEAWSQMVGRPADRLLGSVVGGLLDDRFVAERLARLCDLAELTSSRKQVTLTTAKELVLHAAAEPVVDDGRELVRLVVTPGAPAASGSDDGDLVAVFDTDLRCIEADDGVLRVMGLTREQAIGRTNREMGYPYHMADLWDGHHRAVLTTGVTHVLEHEVPTVAGPRVFRTVIEPVRGADGTPVAVRTASRDLSREGLDAAAPGVEPDDETSAMCLRLEPTPGAAATARAHARDGLTRHVPERPADPVLLVVSELVTNAALHAGTDLVLQVSHVPGGAVRVEVWDASSVVPVIGRPGTVGGRGLALVELLSAAWGSEPTESGGKRVWCEIEAPQPRAAADDGRATDAAGAHTRDDGAAAAAFWADEGTPA